MTSRFRTIASLAVSLAVLAGVRVRSQDQPKPDPSQRRETTGTKKDVEKRLKAEEKPQTVTPLDGIVRTLHHAQPFQQAAVSPDGTKVAWVESLTGKDGARGGGSAIYVKDLKNSNPPQRITAGVAGSVHDEGNVAWSVDSRQIAFLSDAIKKDQRQLYVVSVRGGAPRKLTEVKGFLDAPGWSPDGKTLAVLFTQNATRASGPLQAETPETGEIKDVFFEQRLALVHVATGGLRQISPADTYIYEYDWSPDGAQLAVTAAPGNGDSNWYVAELYTLDPATGLMKAIYKPSLQIARPAWSPDGQRIALIEGLMSDEPIPAGDIYIVPAGGGSAVNATADQKASTSWLAWTHDSKILFAGIIEADSAIGILDPANSSVETVWRGSEKFTSGSWVPTLSVSADRTSSAVIRSSFSAAPEIWAGSHGKWQQITHRNEGLRPGWGEAKSLRWKSGGYEIQGWLLYPRDFDPAKKYPMVVAVHGGPSWAHLSEWPAPSDFAMALPGAGYFVLFPNPRGSYGQGEAFTRANVKDFGNGDFKDILAGADAALKVAPIDPERLGLTGWSYGGYMTMWGVTQTNRFKAAMAGAGIANWISYYGENKIDQWMIPFFGKSVYDDPEVYAKSSPITHIKKAKTPTLILVGDSDGECPTPQSYEFWHALKTLGVETTLVVYEHEGHAFSKPADDRDRIARTVAWFDAHLQAR
jgi:dipeptidyl aminopeptidase/acylaminoacyl peptidase